jgi:hypothetical protein
MMNGFTDLSGRRAAGRMQQAMGVVIASTVLAIMLIAQAASAGDALAATAVKLCVPKTEGSVILTPRHEACKRGYKLTEMDLTGADGKTGATGTAGTEGKTGATGAAGPEGKAGADGKTGATGTAGSEGKAGAEGAAGPEGKGGSGSGFTTAQVEQLKSLLPFISFAASGVGGKPTVQFTGVNVQVLSGAHKTNATPNGEGNLVIGYDENPAKHEQTGSNNLILGEEQTFTSYGGILGGFANSVTGPFASVTGGGENSAESKEAAISGGWLNVVSGQEAEDASVSGGRENHASGEYASVGGGKGNTASGAFSSIFGGKVLTASVEFEAIP